MSSSPSHKGKIRVLLIDDDPQDAELVKEYLSENPSLAPLEWCERLKEGMRRCQRALFDVVLLDLHLPDSHGIETFHRFRAAVPDVPVVVMTGLDDEERALEAVQHGAQDYLPKSRTNAAALARVLRYAVERHG